MAVKNNTDPDRLATSTSVDADHPVVLTRSTARIDDLRAMSILVLDEDADHLITLLTADGFSNMHRAESAEQALTTLQRHAATNRNGMDLILLDITSERFDSHELCRTLHEHAQWREIPIIALHPRRTWHGELLSGYLDAGISDIVFKPADAPDLIPHVLSALLLKRERDIRLHNESELEAELAERKVMEARLQYLVSHDDLTGLSNRRRLTHILESTIPGIRHRKRPGGLIYIDLDQFKLINDLEGHTTGDRLLMNVANILRARLHRGQVLARISSDEYAVLLEDCDESGLMALAESLRQEIAAFRFRTEAREHQISASLGVLVIMPDDIITASDALARSAQACFEAKHHGRNLVHLFNKDDLETSILRDAVDWVPRIREALSQNSFRMLYQPIIDLVDDRVVGYEALIRMVGDNGALITPDHFIPIAERMGLIHDLDLWVVRHAIDTLQGIAQTHPDMTLNVNLSIFAFQDPALLKVVGDRLTETGVSAERITFEITETAAVANYDQTRNMIHQLRDMGCRFALDDFGTGFSSFHYLKQFPVDYLKIDGSFISNLLNDPIDQHLVRSMIEVGRALGKTIVAEYVENPETLELLREYGVNRAQGNYIGLPRADIRVSGN